MVLMRIQLDPAEANVADLADRFHISRDDLDTGYGVVPVNRSAHIYAIKVSEPAAAVIESTDRTAERHSDPLIVPLGRR